MKKQFWAILMALVMVLSMASVAFAEGNVAKIGDTEYPTLQAALNDAKAGDTIILLAECAEDVTVVRAEDVDITIDGSGMTMYGSITVDGRSATYETGSLTIENVNFDATGITKDACINLGDGTNATRYVTNLTVQNCMFTGNGQNKVAIKSYTGGDKNLTVTDCTVDGTMHSLLQVTNVTGLVVDGCTVESKNGINLNSSSDVEIKNSDISVSGYAVRIGVNGGTSGAVTLTNNTLATNGSEGDAAIVLRGSAVTNVDLAMEKNTVSGTTHISGITEQTTVDVNANYWDGQTAPVVGEAAYAVAVDSYYADEECETLVFTNNNVIAAIGGKGYETLNDAVAEANPGDEIKILKAATYEMPDAAKNKTFTITGAVDDVVIEIKDDGSYEHCDYSADGANITLNNVTVTARNDGNNYRGFARCKLTCNDCVINGELTLYSESVFTNCDFNVSGDLYNVWTWGAGKVTFDGCTFNSDGKSLLVYNQSVTVNINKCEFNDNGGLSDLKAAIETGADDKNRKYIINVTDTKVNGYEINDKGLNTGSTLFGNKNSLVGDQLIVFVDDFQVWPLIANIQSGVILDQGEKIRITVDITGLPEEVTELYAELYDQDGKLLTTSSYAPALANIGSEITLNFMIKGDSSSWEQDDWTPSIDALPDFIKVYLNGTMAQVDVCGDRITSSTKPLTQEQWDELFRTVTFETNDGSAIDEQTFIKGEKATKPADPTRSGYKFAGWYSDEKLTTVFDFENTVITEDTTVYAKWNKKSSGGGSSSPSYQIVIDDMDDGDVVASSKSAKRNATVTLTVTADKGYELDELTVTDSKGKKITVTKKSNGKYTFTMPSSKVTVDATFVAEDQDDTTNTDFVDVDDKAYYADAVK
ncbi:MAG: InlB B-repeat-containing protein, partial [Firmicutes bacterium]|nr:InlB B-repeat-containing protein [Bacillota bacterium]